MHARSCWLGQFGMQSKTKFTCEKALWIGDMFVELVLKDGVKLAATGAKTHLFSRNKSTTRTERTACLRKYCVWFTGKI